MRRRQFVCARDLDKCLGKGISHRACARARANEKARASDRRKWHRDLKLWVVVATRAFEGLRPAMVEYVLSTRVCLHITGRRAQKLPTGSSTIR